MGSSEVNIYLMKEEDRVGLRLQDLDKLTFLGTRLFVDKNQRLFRKFILRQGRD